MLFIYPGDQQKEFSIINIIYPEKESCHLKNILIYIILMSLKRKFLAVFNRTILCSFQHAYTIIFDFCRLLLCLLFIIEKVPLTMISESHAHPSAQT